MFVVVCVLKVFSRNIVVINSIHNMFMAINISVYDLFMSQKNINTLDVLTFKQVRTNENKFLQIRR